MRIVADKAIPFLQETFGTLGDVLPLHSREITPKIVREADMLIIRTRTRVDAQLLEGSRVGFVATAAVGTDHVDLDYLRQRGIAFTNAPGSNANAVAEYVLAALFTLAARRNFQLHGTTIGVVGVGNVGSRVVQKAGILGMTVLQNDPPRQRAEGSDRFVTLKEAAASDIVSFHVPLNLSGEDATVHLFDDSLLDMMKPGAILLNTSRGEVASNQALIKGLDSQRLSAVMLDVWEGEPDIDLTLLSKVALGTPHIAAYTQQGKINATRMVYEAACRFLGMQPETDVLNRLTLSLDAVIQIPREIEDVESAVSHSLRQIFPIECDDARLREITSVEPDKRRHFFDDLRNNYTLRHETSAYSVQLSEKQAAWASVFNALGFKTSLPTQTGMPVSL